MALDTHTGAQWGGDMFADQRAANIDGTLTPLPEAEDILSSQRCCDICGTVFDDTWKKHKDGRKVLCRLCAKG